MKSCAETIVLTIDNTCVLPQDSRDSYRSQDGPDGRVIVSPDDAGLKRMIAALESITRYTN